jgi:hypothetical protein
LVECRHSANVRIEGRRQFTDQFPLTEVRLGLASHYLIITDLERLRTVFPYRLAQFPVTTLGEGPTDMLLPATDNRLGHG